MQNRIIAQLSGDLFATKKDQANETIHLEQVFLERALLIPQARFECILSSIFCCFVFTRIIQQTKFR